MGEHQIIKRGEIYMANFDKTSVIGNEQAGTRPVIILQNDIGNKYSTTTIVALITSSIKNHLPTRVELKDIKSDIMLEQIKTISKLRLTHKIGEISEDDLTEINLKLAYSLGLINMKH